MKSMRRWVGIFLCLAVSSAGEATAAEMSMVLDTGVPGQKVEFTATFLQWHGVKMFEASPGHYEVRFEEPWLPEFQYKFIVDGKWLSDPRNPSSVPDGHGGLNSVAKIPSFHEDPFLSERPGTPKFLESRILLRDREGAEREVRVVSPPATAPHERATRSVTIYFQDGGDYWERAGARALLANLSAEPGMPSFTGVFIPPKDRTREYQFLPAYADFVAKDVVREIEKRFPRTGGSRERRLLIGPSLGGLVTLYTALRHREVFGNAASQSGSLWVREGSLLRELGKPVSPSSPALKIFMDCGLYESESMLKYNREGIHAAQRAGHHAVYHEYPTSHDWMGWRNRLQETLRYFFASSSALR